MTSRFKRKNLSIGPRREILRTTTTLFVPSSEGGLLTRMMETREESAQEDTGWSVKILERSGSPLINSLSTRIPLIAGCPIPDKCKVCKNGEGIICTKKNVVYEASCDTCRQNNDITLVSGMIKAEANGPQPGSLLNGETEEEENLPNPTRTSTPNHVNTVSMNKMTNQVKHHLTKSDNLNGFQENCLQCSNKR